MAALIYILLGCGLILKLFYEFRAVEFLESISPNKRLGKQGKNIILTTLVCYLFQYIAGVFTTSAILSKCYLMGKMIWQEDPFQKFAKKFAGFFLDRYPTVNRIAQISLQIFLILIFEVIPLISGVIIGILSRDPTVGIQYFLSFGGFFAMFVCFLWMFGSLLENYKRFVSIIICCRKDYKISKMSKELSMSKKDILDKVDIKKETNFWNLLDWACCEMPIIKFEKFNGAIRSMHLWRGFFMIAGVSVFVIVGVIRFWVALSFV